MPYHTDFWEGQEKRGTLGNDFISMLHLTLTANKMTRELSRDHLCFKAEGCSSSRNSKTFYRESQEHSPLNLGHEQATCSSWEFTLISNMP